MTGKKLKSDCYKFTTVMDLQNILEKIQAATIISTIHFYFVMLSLLKDIFIVDLIQSGL